VLSVGELARRELVKMDVEKPICKRRRSSWYELAHNGLACVSDYGEFKLADIDNIVVYFERWLEKYNLGKYVLLNKISDVNEWVFVRGVTRFQAVYKRKLWFKLSFLQDVDFRHHIVLEVNPHNHGLFINEFEYMNRAWCKLRAWIFKTYGKFDFLRIVELHKSGRPHFHVLIAGIEYLDYNKIESIWSSKGKYGVGFSKRRAVRSDFNALWYLLKYVKKCVVGGESFDKQRSAIYFATNRRLFSVSRGLLDRAGFKSKKKAEVEYRFVGSRPAVTVNEFFVSRSEALDSMFYRVVIDQKDLYDFPYLFFVDDG